MNILCLISSLQGGGAERVMTWLSASLVERGHRVTLACQEEDVLPPAYGRPQGVSIRYLNLLAPSGSWWGAIRANVHRILTLRRLYREVAPQVVVSFMDRTNILAIAAGIGTGYPIVASEHTDPGGASLSEAWGLGRRLLYPRCSRLILLSEGLRRWFAASLQARIRVIANPVIPFPGEAIDLPPVGQKRLLAVGRLDPVKGFDLLLKAFARLAPIFQDWDLRIQGEGTERGNLEGLVLHLGLRDRVDLPGHTSDPGPVFRGANLFVLSSRFEGFPMALVEAMGVGLPTVATACTSAISEILDEGRSGLLVAPESVDSLVEGLARLMGDAEQRKAFGQAGRLVAERYAPAAILDQWEAILQEATA